VAQKDRISIDVSDLREEIEACRNDAAWSELPLSAKIRVLIKERLEQLKAEKEETK
jgi:outer membrane murein-binding lipoprotein Lpp